jgi:hypothetical protein
MENSFTQSIRSCCFHETAQNLERTEIANILLEIAKQMRPIYKRNSATFDPCLWLELKADAVRYQLPDQLHSH